MEPLPSLAHVSGGLNRLASLCVVVSQDPVSGWTLDTWELTFQDLDALVDLYHDLIVPDISSDVLSIIESAGVDLSALFYDEPPADAPEKRIDNANRVTRADMVELAAAASLIAVEGLSTEMILMPNVPKGSRRQSAPGIDVMGVVLNPAADVRSFSDDEKVVICSVKHSLEDCGDLRRKLVDSLSDGQLSAPYILQQLRVLHGRLQERHIDAEKIFLILSFTPVSESSHVHLVGVGAVDITKRNEMDEESLNFPSLGPRARHLRRLFFPQISKLHERVAP